MGLIRDCCHSTITGIEKVRWFPPLLARITLGWVFVESGWGKVNNLPQVIEFFQSLGIPYAELQAPFVAGMELVAGALILFGLFSRMASIPLVVTMIVALVTAKREDIHSVSDLFASSEYLYIVLLLWLLVAGAGTISVDAWLSEYIGWGRKKGRY